MRRSVLIGLATAAAMTVVACGTDDPRGASASPSASAVPGATLHPALGAQVPVAELAGISERSRPDGPQADVVAQTDAASTAARLAAFKSGGQTCMALVKPAPGLTVCEPPGLQPSEMVATGTAGPNELASGNRSLFFGYAPSGTTTVVMEAAGSTQALDVFVAPSQHAGRVFFITEMPPPADRRLVFRGYDERGKETSSKTLG